MKRQLLSLLLILSMVFTLTPVASFGVNADSSTKTVTIRVEDNTGNTLVKETSIELERKDLSEYGLNVSSEPESITPLHVLAEYMDKNATGDVKDNLKCLSSGFVTEILGSKGGTGYDPGWMYCVNDAPPMLSEKLMAGITDYEIKNGDEIVLYGVDSFSSNYYYSYFDSKEYQGEAGEPIPMELNGIIAMKIMSGIIEKSTISGAKLLIDKVDGNEESSETETNYTTDTEGKVFPVFDEPGTYIISAKKDNEISKPLAKVNISASNPAKDAETVILDMNNLTLPQETDKNLDLPFIGKSGKTSISWTSEDESIIDNSGKIFRPEYGNPAVETTLSALIKKADAQETKAFKVKVLPITQEEIESLIDEIFAAFNTGSNRFTAKELDGDANPVDVNLITALQARADKAIQGSTIGIVSSENENVASNGDITYGTSNVTKNVTVSIKLSDVTVEKVLSVRIPKRTDTAQQVIDKTANGINWNSIKNKNTSQEAVTTNLNLTRGDSMSTKVDWTSSDTTTISPSYGTGTVKRPAYGEPDKGVRLTATVSDGPLLKDMHPGAFTPTSKSIDVTVAAITENEYNEAKADVDLLAEKLKDPEIFNIKYTSGKDDADLSAIDKDLSLSIDSKLTNGASYSWESDNPAITVNYQRGIVTVPDIGSPVGTGQLKVTLTKNGYSKTVLFDTSVPPIAISSVVEECMYLNTVRNDLNFDKIKGENSDIDNVFTNLKPTYRGYVDEDGNTSWLYSNLGETGAKIEWDIDDPGAMGAYDIIRPDIGKDQKTVTLTAKISSQKIKDTRYVPVLTKKFVVTVLPYSYDLSTIDLTTGKLDEEFTADVTDYNIKDIPYGTRSTKISFEKEDPTAEISVEGAEQIDDTDSYNVDLNDKLTEIKVAVKSNKKTRNYTFKFHISEPTKADKKMTVYFDGNKGKSQYASKVVYRDHEFGSLPKATRKGYTFKGWYTSKSGGTKITSKSIVALKDKTKLYAQWTTKKYTVKLNGNKGKVKSKIKKVTFETKIGKLPKPTRKGYKFKGWYTKKKGGKKITSKTIYKYGKSIKLYAQWKKK